MALYKKVYGDNLKNIIKDENELYLIHHPETLNGQPDLKSEGAKDVIAVRFNLQEAINDLDGIVRNRRNWKVSTETLFISEAISKKNGVSRRIVFSKNFSPNKK